MTKLKRITINIPKPLNKWLSEKRREMAEKWPNISMSLAIRFLLEECKEQEKLK